MSLVFASHSEIILVHDPVSFIKGIDGLVAICRQVLEREPMDRCYFLFINRARKQIRSLWYDGQGFNLCTKRLSTGTFYNWPRLSVDKSKTIEFFEAQLLWSAGDMSTSKFKPLWKKIA